LDDDEGLKAKEDERLEERLEQGYLTRFKRRRYSEIYGGKIDPDRRIVVP
jgi:hypothetical protein